MSGTAQTTEALLSEVLPQLIVMIGAARIFHVLARLVKQPGVTGEIVAGLMLGPSCFGHVFPHTSLALFPRRPPPSQFRLSARSG